MDVKIKELLEKQIKQETYIKELKAIILQNEQKNMNLSDIKTLKDISLEYNIPIPTLKTRLTLTSFELIENLDYRKMEGRQGTLLSPSGVEKIIKKGWGK